MVKVTTCGGRWLRAVTCSRGPVPDWWPVRAPCRRVGGALLLSLRWSWSRPSFPSFAARMQSEAFCAVYGLVGYCRLGDGTDPRYQRPFMLFNTA